MANTIDQAFTQLETEVHLVYQRMGSNCNTVRQATGVTGSTARFRKLKGTANTKSRNGDVTSMELVHTRGR